MVNLCVIALCKNEGRHLIPKEQSRRQKWIEAITNHVKPGFTVRKYSYLCSAHFQRTDFSETPPAYQRPDLAPIKLKKSAIPSIFPSRSECIEKWTPPSENATFIIPDLKPPSSNNLKPENDHETDSQTKIMPKMLKRHTIPSIVPWLDPSKVSKTYSRPVLPTAFAEEIPFMESTLSDIEKDPLESRGRRDDCKSYQMLGYVEASMGVNSIVDTVIEGCNADPNLKTKITLESSAPQVKKVLKSEKSTQTDIPNESFSIHDYKHNDKAIYFYTGLESFKIVNLAFTTLGESIYELKYFYSQTPKITPLNQLFLTLIILRRHLTFEEISFMFLIPLKQVYNIFITWIRFMAMQWRIIDLWADRETVHAYALPDFYDNYPNHTRAIFDAFEFPITKPSLPMVQQVTFSTFKNRNTVKLLLGITPSGLINYISPCYGGSATDRQIIEQSAGLDQYDFGDEITIDKGSNVQDIFLGYGIKVNVSSDLKKPKDLIADRKGASKCGHVEKVFGMLNTYKILQQPLNNTEAMLSSDIVYICAMLVNFRTIINKTD